jgi:hypothetical protein
MHILRIGQGLNANAPIAIMVVIYILRSTISYNGGDSQNVVGHHVLGRGGVPINAVRASVLQLCTIKEDF